MPINIRRREVLNAQGNYKQVVDFLNEQTGVRVYRDGIRVFNYGEPNDDWLGLNIKRINRPGGKIGSHSIIAAIELNLEKSHSLHEKTNREGFDENNSFRRFRLIIESVVEVFTMIHKNDRQNIQDYIQKGGELVKPDPVTKFGETIESIRQDLKKYNLENKIGGKVDRIEKQYLQMREVTLSSGLAGINLAVIFHEVERGVIDLNRSIKNGLDNTILVKKSDHLARLLDGFAPLLKRNEQKTFSLKILVERSLELSGHRLEYHKIILSNRVESVADVEIYGPFGLLQASINNLIDNAIHWSRWKAEQEGVKPAISLFSLPDYFEEGPALVVADNGPGFQIEADEAIQPFVTMRPGGMGLGLYYANMVMESIGGKLLIFTPDELDLPKAYDGVRIPS